MKEYRLSFLVGCGVGLAYAALRVRSPAPPLVAIVGLVGMLAGEQAIPALRTWHTASQHAAHGSTGAKTLLASGTESLSVPIVPAHMTCDMHLTQPPKKTP